MTKAFQLHLKVFNAFLTVLFPFLVFSDQCFHAYLDFPIYSKYVFRGQDIVNGPVFQPRLDVVCDGFEVWVFGNMNLSNDSQVGVYEGALQFTEFQLDANYRLSHNRWNYSFGIIDYVFAHEEAHDTQEIYISAACDLFFNPTFTVYRDINQVSDGLAEIEVFEVFEEVLKVSNHIKMGCALGAAIRFQGARYVKEDYGIVHARMCFTDCEAYLLFPFYVFEKWIITPSVRYTALINRRIRDASPHPDNLIGGLCLTAVF